MLDESTGLGLAATPATSIDQSILEHKIRLESQQKSAAGWFFAIAGLSLVNSVIMLFGGMWHFLIGLGITTFFDAVAYRLASSVANIAAFVINVFILCIPVLFGVFARKGHKWAFIVGMILYAFDGLILLLFRDWLGVAFHVYALFMIYRGVTATDMLKQIEETTMAARQ